jgi:uncharacterized SAM-binding protein YcdF (DUF218 family)
MNLYQRWIVEDNPPVRPDCFVVLSYAVEDGQNPTVPTQAVIRLAAARWKKFPRSVIIMSTGDNQKLGVPNSRVMTLYAVGLGVPRRNLIEENRSRTTYENLIYSREIIKKRKLKNITLVTYDLHMRRTLAVAKKLGWKNLTWVSAPSPGSPAYGIKRFQTYSRLTIFCYELLATVYNRLRGEL